MKCQTKESSETSEDEIKNNVQHEEVRRYKSNERQSQTCEYFWWEKENMDDEAKKNRCPGICLLSYRLSASK